jgi:hypothetical protein
MLLFTGGKGGPVVVWATFPLCVAAVWEASKPVHRPYAKRIAMLVGSPPRDNVLDDPDDNCSHNGDRHGLRFGDAVRSSRDWGNSVVDLRSGGVDAPPVRWT